MAHAVDDFLPVEEAFEFKVDPIRDKTVHFHWSMPAGYLLYRDRLRVGLHNPDVRFSEPTYPPAETHNDEFFGPQRVYRGSLDIDAPFVCLQSATGPLVLEVSYQGCAEAGLCYPTQVLQLSLDLPDGLCGR